MTLRVEGRQLHIPKLSQEISGATWKRKPGKNQLVVKLTKADASPWTKLAGEIVSKNSGGYTQADVKKRTTNSEAAFGVEVAKSERADLGCDQAFPGLSKPSAKGDAGQLDTID
jgi:phosphoenolpyruvate synthase/pyruvate phosphate dikinase